MSDDLSAAAAEYARRLHGIVGIETKYVEEDFKAGAAWAFEQAAKIADRHADLCLDLAANRVADFGDFAVNLASRGDEVRKVAAAIRARAAGEGEGK